MVAAARGRQPGRACLLVVAAAGYGKTTALETAGASTAGDAVLTDATRLLAALDGPGLPADVTACAHLLVDDLDEVDAQAQVRLAAAIGRLTSPRLTLASARTPDPVVLAALRRPVGVQTARDVALRPGETARVLREEHGIDDLDVAEEIQTASAGWPALVHALAVRPAAAALRGLVERVLAPLSADESALLTLAAGLGGITEDLAVALAAQVGLDPVAAGRGVAGLADAGLLRALAESDAATLRVVPLLDDPGHRPVLARAVVRTAADQLVAAAGAVDGPAAAAAALQAATLLDQLGDRAACAALLSEHGELLLRRGGAAELALLLKGLHGGRQGEGERGDDVLIGLLADARRLTGDAHGALQALAPMIRRADLEGGWPPGLARRVAQVHHLRAEPREVLEVCGRVRPPAPTGVPGAELAERALLAALEVTALHFAGQEARAGQRLPTALELAEASGRGTCRAAAHLAAAIGARSTRRDAHLRSAAEAAEADGDVVTLLRVLVNQTDAALGQARYAEAAALARRTAQTMSAGSGAGLRAVAHANACAALRRVGEMDQARFHGECSVRLSRRHGLEWTAFGLGELGELAAAQGRREQARLLLEEAADLARDSGQVHTLVPVLSALTRLLAQDPAVPAEVVEDLAGQAVAVAPQELLGDALVAQGWAAVRAGDDEAAADSAARAVVAGRAARRLPALAAALELTGTARRDVASARAALREAADLWGRSGAVVDADRLAVVVARLPGATSEDRAAARDAARRLADWGVWVPAAEAAADTHVVPVQVRVLGGFEVRAGGRPVPLNAWRSRQARVLVKILVARRGRPIARGEICELLWPDDDPARTSHRLSVVLSVVRGVLDPAKAWPADHFIRGDILGLCLDTGHVSVDAEELLLDVAHADEVRRAGDLDRARALFAAVDSLYGGEAFDEEPYEDWAAPLREEVRAAWMRALRRHAELCFAAHEVDDAVADLVKLLTADPYDESAHRSLVQVLVGAGRHGEARRAFDRWRRAMETIDAPAPDPALLAGHPGGPGRPRPTVADVRTLRSSRSVL